MRPVRVAAALAALGAALPASAGAALPPDAAWVATHADVSDPGNTVTVAGLALGARRTSAVSTGSQPAALAVTLDTRRVLVANYGADTLSVVDVTSGTVTGRVRVGIEPDAVAVVPGGTREAGLALVANFGSDTVTPVDLGTLRAGPAIPAGHQPDAIAVTPGSTARRGSALVADYGADAVQVISLATRRPGPAVAVGSEPVAIVMVPSLFGPSAVVANFGSNTLSVVDLATLATGPAVPLGGNPTGLAVAPLGSGPVTLWVTDGAELTPVSGRGRVFTPGVPVPLRDPGEAVDLAYGPGRQVAWVAQQNGWLVPVSLPAGPPGRGIYVSGHPSAVVLPFTGR